MNLLISESPMILLPSLATLIGVDKAIVLQQINYWINSSHAKQSNSHRWIRNSAKQWQMDNFPFWSERKVGRLLESLEADGLIRSRDDLNKSPGDRTKWYTINPDQLTELTNGSAVASVTGDESSIIKEYIMSSVKTDNSPKENKDAVRKRLEQHFVEITRLTPPTSKRTAGALWWSPLRTIAELAEWDAERGCQLIDRAIRRLKGITIKSPKSLLNTVKTIAMEDRLNRGMPDEVWTPAGNGTSDRDYSSAERRFLVGVVKP